jgi:hypothetical protein
MDLSNIRSVTFTLRWTDEPDARINLNNEPDEFTLEVSPPNATVESATSTTGTVQVTITYDPPNTEPYYNGTGEYIVTVMCGVCGDHEPIINIIGIRGVEDTGNAWTLEVSYQVFVQPGL